jgi:hypothetical protein
MSGLLPARRAQNINARVSDTLPEVVKGLKRKPGTRCEQIVIVPDLLWIILENGEESAASKH